MNNALNTTTAEIHLFFDTETTGLLKYSVDLLDPSQPRIVQLAAILTDGNNNVLEELDTLIKPDGWTISEEMTKIHGITTEMCEQHGIPMAEALAKFNAMKAKCTARHAYNLSFDKRMLAREAGAHGVEHTTSEHIESACVMEMARQAIKEAPMDRRVAAGHITAKSVKLGQVYKFFIGEEMQNAHNAMPDVKATAKLYFRLRDIQSELAA